jgi:hypothetical protein
MIKKTATKAVELFIKGTTTEEGGDNFYFAGN